MDSFAPQAIPATAASEVFQLMRDGQARTKAEIAELTSLGALDRRRHALDAPALRRTARPCRRGRVDRRTPPGQVRAQRRVVRGARDRPRGVATPRSRSSTSAGEVLGEVSVASDIADGPQIVLDRVADLGVELLADLDLDPGCRRRRRYRRPRPGRALHRPTREPADHAGVARLRHPRHPRPDVPRARPGRQRRQPDGARRVRDVVARDRSTSCWSRSPPASARASSPTASCVRGALGTAGDLGHVQVAGQARRRRRAAAATSGASRPSPPVRPSRKLRSPKG